VIILSIYRHIWNICTNFSKCVVAQSLCQLLLLADDYPRYDQVTAAVVTELHGMALILWPTLHGAATQGVLFVLII
jgi:hypothetical protein